MKKVIYLLFTIVFFSACSDMNKPVKSQIAQAQSLTNNSISIESYEIPRGVFRGVLWPDPEKPFFSVWVINNQKELYYRIDAPKEFTNHAKNVTSEWNIKITDAFNKKVVLANSLNKMKELRIELPVKKRNYSFCVLRNAAGGELFIFMDISENIVDDSGLFGYLIIN